MTVLCVSAVIFAATFFVPSAAVTAAPTSEFGVACDPSAGNDRDRTYDALLSAPGWTVVEDRRCISCHRLRDAGERALHICTRDAKAMGGNALPFERYPAVARKRFVFQQEAVANAVDFTPEGAQAPCEMIVAERERRGVTRWRRPERDCDRP